MGYEHKGKYFLDQQDIIIEEQVRARKEENRAYKEELDAPSFSLNDGH
jgi:hypothetical protein